MITNWSDWQEELCNVGFILSTARNLYVLPVIRYFLSSSCQLCYQLYIDKTRFFSTLSLIKDGCILAKIFITKPNCFYMSISNAIWQCPILAIFLNQTASQIAKPTNQFRLLKDNYGINIIAAVYISKSQCNILYNRL